MSQETRGTGARPGRERFARFRGAAGGIVPRTAGRLRLGATVLLSALIAIAALRRPGLPSAADTIGLVHGSHAILSCVKDGVWTRCDSRYSFAIPGLASEVWNGRIEGDVGPLALYQYLPVMVLIKLGLTDLSIYKALIVTNMISVLLVIALFVRLTTLTARRSVASLGVLFIVTSPLVLYATTTFGEPLAAALLTLSVAACLRRWPPAVLGVCALVACLTKETVFPAVTLLGAVALWRTPIGRGRLRAGHWWGLGTGIVAGEAVSTAFNWFRYHQLTNFTYGHAFETVPGIGRRLGLAVALWLAPNGGVALFWLLAGMMALGVATAVIRWAMVSRRRSGIPMFVVLVVLLIATGTLASWWAPFGWIAWGPRLLLPVLPAIALCVLAVWAPAVELAVRRLVRRPLVFAVCLVLVLGFALPQVNALNDPTAISSLFVPDATCPTIPSPLSDRDGYYRCIEHLAWGHHWILPDTFSAWKSGWGLVDGVLFLVGWATLAGATRLELTSSAEEAATSVRSA